MADTNNLMDNKMVDYWAEAWRKATSIRRGDSLSKKNLNKNISMWNNRANSFAQNTAKEKNKARQKEVFDFLDYCGVKLAGMDVLDVGCGPGNYTIPLAKLARHVWALDPASNMLNIVRDRAEKEGITNITYINKPWEEINLAREGWVGKFDLVFASMTPGVNDKETLGDDGAIYFQMLAHDFKMLELQRLKGEAQKIPPKIRIFSFIMLMCFLFTYLAIIGYEIIKSQSG